MSEGDILNALPMTLSPRKKSSLKVSHLRKQSGDTHGFNSLTRINTSGLNALVEVATPITPNVEIPISLSAPEALRRVSKTAVSVKSKLSSNSQSIPSSLQNVSSAPQFNDTSTHINLRLPSIAAIEVSQKDEVVQEMNAFLTFRSPEVELSYGRYFMIKTIPLWRTGLIVGFLLSVIMFIFNLLNRTPNYFVTETLIYVFAVVLPLTILLYISSNTFKSPTIFVNLVHYISTFSILIIGGISLSIRHYIQENKEPAYKTALFYSLLVLGAHLVLRIRFIFLVFAIPCLFTFFVIEASITSVQNIASANETTNHLFTSTICLFAFMLVTLFSSYKSEQSSRLDFTTTSSSKASASKLRDQLNRLQKTYTNQSGEFDSPLEKSIVIVRSIMADPAIKSKHVNALSKLLGLLKSGDLMTPQIEKQVEGAELDKDQEAWLLSNLYRNKMTKQVGNPRTKSSFDADLELNPFVPKNESINTFHPPQRKASLHYQTNSTDSTSFPNYNFRSGDRNFRTKEGSIISSKYGSPARKESNLGTSIRTQDPADISTSSNMLPTIAQTSPIELDLEKSLQGNQNQSKEVKKDHQQKEQPQPVRTDRSNSAPEETSFYNEIASDIAEILHNFGSKHTTTFEESERRISSIDVSKIIQRNSSILKTISEVSTKSNKSTLDSRDFSIVENKLKNLMGGIMPPTSSSKQQILSIVSAKSGFTGSSQPSAEINEKDVFTFERALPDFSRIISVLEKIDHWNWDIFELNDFANGWPLFTLSNFLFTKSELFVKFKISRRHFLKFVNLVERGYKDIPYHNSIHATDVLHGVNWLKDRCSILICPSDMETMAIYFAAIIHDYDHPGVNNNFLVSTLDKKALLYNDRSVLENHHIASAFAVLMKPENGCNFLDHLTREEFKSFREIVIELVLATDLQSQHFILLSSFKHKLVVTETFDPENNAEDRILLWKMMIKCADVSNPTKKQNIYDKWTERVLDEFFAQGDEEKRQKIPVSPYYDRESINIPASQLGFIEFICLPLYEAFNHFMEIQCILEGIQTNRSIWQKIKDDNVAKELSKSRKNSSDEISKGGAVLPPLPIALGKTSSTPNLKSESSVDKKLSGKANNSTFVASDRPEKDARKLSIFGLKKDKGVMK